MILRHFNLEEEVTVNGKLEEPLKLNHRGTSVTTSWKHRERMHGFIRKNAEDHIVRLEAEVERLRGLLYLKEESLTSMHVLVARLDQIQEELNSIRREFVGLKGNVLDLSEAEKRVYNCYISDRNLTSKEMGEKLGCSRRTITFHMSNIMWKAGVSSRGAL